MSQSIKRKDGRRYKVDSNGINSLRRKYQVVMDSTMDAEATSFTGVPAIGSAHPSFPSLRVVNYDIEEGEDSAKKTLTVYVNYERDNYTNESDSSGTANAVEHWGWDSSTDSKELITDADGKDILNSAGDPFDSVPQVSVYSPVFTKIIKFSSRKTDALSCNCKVNNSQVTIGSMNCPEGTLLCSVEEERLIDDPNFKYRYTVRLKYKTNKAKIAQSQTATEIGWDVAVTDKGVREIKDSRKVYIVGYNPETGEPCTISSPELLDGNGAAISRSASGAPANPYNFRFKAYERCSIPSWFYSEPS